MVSRSRVRRVNLYAIPQLLPILLPKALVWIRWHMYRMFLNPLSNCALDISLPFENMSYEFFAVQLIREETGIHFFESSISNSRLSNIPPPPDSTVNWDSHDKRKNPIPREGQSLSKARRLILFCAQLLGGEGSSRKAPVPDRRILFTERRHVGG